MAHKQRVNLQIVTHEDVLPSKADFNRWVGVALEGRREPAEITIRIVDEDEGIELNQRYRHKDSATNVLSFPAQLPAGVATGLLGDLVICAPVVIREAREQAKQTQAHWAHLTIHGTLHLLGYEHETGIQAEVMESLETTMLASLGYPDPYSM